MALRNTCAAAANKATLPAHERQLAAAIAAALVDPSRGLSAAHMNKLVEWELLGPADHSGAP